MRELSLHILDIIENSRRAEADLIKIIIKEKIEKNFLKIIIEDNGIGISERDFGRVFKIFQKVDGGDDDSHGIGLAICKKIVETHFDD